MKRAIAEIEESVKPVLHAHGVKTTSVVGSVARREHTVDSDIDIVVEITSPLNLTET